MRTVSRRFVTLPLVVGMLGALSAKELPGLTPAKPAEIKDIKAYCLDFNWAATGRKRKPFAAPGTWAGADPAQHVAWYKAMGANVIQTFCVSCNGYAWYKNGFVPEQPGLRHDFLPEVVRLGHKEGMLVFGYFCIASNPIWGAKHPDLSYGVSTGYHIPYTDEYLDYLSKSISDAVKKTGIDGFMIDWVWMPERKSTKNQWLACEKKLYTQLMNEPFPGEDKLTEKSPQYTAYSRKAIDRCWKAIRKAAKDANPNCIVWLTSNNTTHPHVVNSDMYKEADWLMNESGDKKRVDAVRGMVGPHTRLITCLARWNGQDATKVVPEALQAGIGLYGFTVPRNNGGLVPLNEILSRPVSELKGDDRNIAVLARAYQGASLQSVADPKGRFIEPPSHQNSVPAAPQTPPKVAKASSSPVPLKDDCYRAANIVVGCYSSGKAALQGQEGLLQLSMLVRDHPLKEWVAIHYDPGKTTEEKLLKQVRTRCAGATIDRVEGSPLTVMNPRVTPGEVLQLRLDASHKQAITRVELPERWTLEGEVGGFKSSDGVIWYTIRVAAGAKPGETKLRLLSGDDGAQPLEATVEVVRWVR